MIEMMNEYWKQAKIEWYLEEILYMNIKSDTKMDENSLLEVRNQIWSLHRDPNTGKMKNKEIRRQLFLDKLMEGYQSDLNTFDVYVFEFIGKESQGCCISRDTYTIIIGNKSTKGYIEPTIRPLPCLAKTCAHELGHALQLDHPKGMKFSNGVSCTFKYHHDNLMIGGADIYGIIYIQKHIYIFYVYLYKHISTCKYLYIVYTYMDHNVIYMYLSLSKGGGGTKLEDWQILVTRKSAEEFWKCEN